jgi:amino acid adenylation domain-containing protein/non-ribosomal peptide synthase protein (TIGR01720 family)
MPRTEGALASSGAWIATLSELVCEVAHFTSDDVTPDAHLMELGLDSLMLMAIVRQIEARHGVRLKLQQIFEELHTVRRLALHLEELGLEPGAPAPPSGTVARGPAQVSPDPEGDRAQVARGAPSMPLSSERAPLASADLGASLFEAQLRLMERVAQQNVAALQAVISQQLAAHGGNVRLAAPPLERAQALPANDPSGPTLSEGRTGQPAPIPSSSETGSATPLGVAARTTAPPVAFRAMQLAPAKGLSEAQRAFVASVSERFQRRTPGSKRQTAESRPVLADWKQTFSFWSQFKEAKYPIISARSKGPRFWDVDGNEYVDIAMGMGVHFFGHSPAFVVEALSSTLAAGMELGTQSRLTGDVARLISELTGVERVAFSNTGTEAVMVCMRLARAATGRNKVVLFDNSFHGIFDGVLGVEWEGRVEPIGPGTPKSMVSELIILKYGDPASLSLIAERATEIAAVLVEPVQSRDPDLQPQQFLRRLRQLTRERDIALIFDEMITGFRCHPGGAQAVFGIEADIVAYGKVAGGGLPIGVIAGKARYLDYIDGGDWRYGDNSGPRSELIFFGGTFGRNPMTMTAARAALGEIARRGPGLMLELNARTTAFVDRLNAWLERREVPLRAKHFASQFRIVPTEEVSDLVHPLELELLYLGMSMRGVYTWERRICFFSTEHGPAEVEAVFAAITESIDEIRVAGFPFREARPHRRQFLPVTGEQRRLYAICQRPGAESAYHLPSALWIDGPLDPERLELAFADVIMRHEGLRTSFHLLEGDVYQKVHQDVRFSFERADVEASEVVPWLRSFCRPFDLSTAPLLRVALLRISAERHLLCADAHHIAVDGVSFDVMAAEVMALYEGRALAPVAHQLRDVPALLLLAGGGTAGLSSRRQVELDFWTELLSGDLPVLELPMDRARGARRDFAGGHVSSCIDAVTTRRLKALARERGVSLYMLLLGVYATLLHRLSGQEDLCIGAPTAGRPTDELSGIVGMLANTVVLRLRPRADLEFSTFLEELKATCTACYDHADYPFGELVAALANTLASSGASSDGRNPLFDTMLSYERADGRSFQLADLRFRRAEVSAAGSMFDLNLDIIEEAEQLHLDWGFASAWLDPSTIERWASHFRTLIGAVLTDPRRPLGDLPLLEPGELSLLLGTWAGADAGYPRQSNLLELFEARARELPEQTALVHAGRASSYAELSRDAGRVARRLRHLGIEPGDFVGVLMEPSAALVTVLLGVLGAGAAYVPLDPSHPRERVAFMLEDSAVKALIHDAHPGERLALPSRGRLDLSFADLLQAESDEGVGLGAAASPELPRVDPDSPAYVIYTSGSTGVPKGCVISHRNVVRLLVNDAFGFDFSPSDTWIVCHSFCFDVSVWEMYGALLHGGRLVVPTRQQVRDPALLLALLSEHRVSILNQTPAAFENLMRAELAREGSALASHLRLVIFAGERLDTAVLRPWVMRHPLERIALVNMYGITETTVHVTQHRVRLEETVGPGAASRIGRPLPETRVYVCNSRLQPQPLGVVGEILVGGSGVSAGYLKRPELNAAKFLDNPFGQGRLYRSGDLGRWLPDGSLEYGGRLDHQIKLHGFRIEPAEVVRALLAHGDVRQAFVILDRHAGSTALVAYVVLSGELDVLGLREFLLERLPAHMVPAYFVKLDALPTTHNGKVDRRALPPPGRQPDQQSEADRLRAGGAGAPSAPETGVERALVGVLQDVLGVATVRLGDNYYALGGDSIKAIFVATALQKQGYELAVADVLAEPAVRALAKRIGRSARSGAPRAGALVGNEPVAGPAPLSTIQHWFFERHLTSPEHDVHWVALESRERLDVGALGRAWEAVVAHHDQLRVRFAIAGAVSAATQRIESPGRIELTVLDRRTAPTPFRPIAEEVEPLVARFDLDTGPLACCVLTQLPDADRLLLVVHHLAIDTVSWRILLDDLADAYAAEREGARPELSPKTVPYLAWAEAQRDGQGFRRSAAEREYYAALLATPTRSFVLAPAAGPRVYADQAQVAASLTAQQTEALLGASEGSLEGSLEELLLAAFALALQRSVGPGAQRILLEGHGRDGTLDVTRTVGWFTRLRGIALDLPDGADLAEVLRHVRARRAAAPAGGAGLVGLAEGGAGTPERPLLDAFPISFNYLGDISEHGSRGPWQLLASGTSRSPRLERPTLLDFEARVQGGRLELNLAFDSVRLSSRDMHRLLNDSRDALLDLIEHQKTRRAGAAPSPARFSPSLLKALGLDASQVEAVAPCSSAQEGILFHALLGEGEQDQSYFEQLGIELLGELDETSLRGAVTQLVRRHAVLRTSFVHDEPPRPVQVVRRDVRVPFELVDLGGLGEAEQLGRVEQLRALDRQRGFDLRNGPLLRLLLIRLDQQRHLLIWSHHHILLDGWSLGVLFQELFDVYAASAGRAGGARNTQSPPLAATLPYTSYVEWLERRDARASLDYFRHYLSGYQKLVSLPRLPVPAGGRREFQHRVLALRLSPFQSQSLGQRCRELQVTLNTLIQSAWGMVLAAENETDDVVFGSVVSSRPVQLEHVERAVGLYLQTLPVRVRRSAGEGLAQVARRCQKEAAQSAEHLWASLAEIQGLTSTPQGLLDHAVVFENYPIGSALGRRLDETASGLAVGRVDAVEHMHYDFSLVVEPGEELELQLVFDAGRIDPELCRRVLGALVEMLTTLVSEEAAA